MGKFDALIERYKKKIIALEKKNKETGSTTPDYLQKLNSNIMEGSNALKITVAGGIDSKKKRNKKK